MLARLQRLIAFGLAALVALWVLLAWRAGHPGWALGGAVLIVFGYALVLGIEFALLHFTHGDDSVPKATPAQLLRAWGGEVCAAPVVFCWRQPFRSQRWPDNLPSGVVGRRGVLLLHGFVCNRGLWNPWLKRLHARGQPCLAVNLEPVFGSIDDYLAIIDKAVARLEQATGQAPVIVAHSMGGLALRRWWAEEGNDARVHHAITIGTPHHGTWLARYALTPNGREMQLNSPWQRGLVRRERAHVGGKLTCFYGNCDNIVFPPSTAMLAGADNRHLAGVAHVHMADRPEPWEEALRRLN